MRQRQDMSRGWHRSPAADSDRQLTTLQRVFQGELVLPGPALKYREMAENSGKRTVVALVGGAGTHRMKPGPRVFELVHDLQAHAESHPRPVAYRRGRA